MPISIDRAAVQKATVCPRLPDPSNANIRITILRSPSKRLQISLSFAGLLSCRCPCRYQPGAQLFTDVLLWPSKNVGCSGNVVRIGSTPFSLGALRAIAISVWPLSSYSWKWFIQVIRGDVKEGPRKRVRSRLGGRKTARIPHVLDP